MTREEEQYCLKELSGGSRHAFERLFLEWHPRLVDFFTRVLDSPDAPDLANDFAQDIFFDIWMSRSKFSQVNSFSAYLFKMARYKIYNHFDRQAVISRYKHELSVADSGAVPSGESALYAMERESLMLRILNRLPGKRRKVFMMSRLLGFSNDQIASELGISKRTVENQITSVLSVFRKNGLGK